MKDRIFVDTNVLLYLLSNDSIKKEISKKLLKSKYIISTQVLNEFSSVCIKKFKLSIIETRKILQKIIEEMQVCYISEHTILNALEIKEKYNFQFYDSLIISTALENNCNLIYSEDMQDKQIVNNKLKIINPFS